MARLAVEHAIAQAPVRSRALCATSVALRVVSAVATGSTATTMTVITSARTLRDVLRDAALQVGSHRPCPYPFEPSPKPYLLA